MKLSIEIQSNISSATAGNSLTDSSKTLSKALVSESGHEHLISSPAWKYTVDLVVKAKFRQMEQQCNLLTTNLLYLGSGCASPSTCQGWGGRGYPWSVKHGSLHPDTLMALFFILKGVCRPNQTLTPLTFGWFITCLGTECGVNSGADTNFCIWKALKCFRSYVLSYMTDI